MDYWIVCDLLTVDRWPRAIMVAFNPTLLHDLVYMLPWLNNNGNWHSATFPALLEIAYGFGHRLVECTQYNAFFVHQEKADCVISNWGVPERMVDNLKALTNGDLPVLVLRRQYEPMEVQTGAVTQKREV